MGIVDRFAGADDRGGYIGEQGQTGGAAAIFLFVVFSSTV